MTFNITVSNIPGLAFNVNTDETILQAAQRQEIDIPVGCENGLCGACKGHLDHGEVSYNGKEIYGLMPDEIEEGEILLCSAYAKSDLVISHHEIEPPKKVYHQELPICTVEPLSEYVWTIKLTTPTPWIFKPGQYLYVNYEGERFPLSISNAPGMPELELQVQIYPETTHHQTLHRMIQMKTLTIEGPFGEAYLKPGTRPLLFIAGGSGFAPIKSMLEHLIKSGSKRPVHIYWGARKPDYLYQHNLLIKWSEVLPNLNYIPVISEDDPKWTGKTGLVHHVAIADTQNLISHDIYLAGPFDMVYGARDDLVAQGINTRMIHGDALSFEKS